MSTTCADLVAAGDRLFSRRENLLNFWQDVAEQFSPSSADFTTTQTLGTDYASHLATSHPILTARELMDSFGVMFRPTNKDAAIMVVDGLEDHEGKLWLERATKMQRRAMYDRKAQYVISSKGLEHDLAIFGQGVKSIDVMPDKSSLLFRTWHLRDCVWSDDLAGSVECVHRQWKPTAYELAQTFGEEKLHPKVRDQLTKQSGKDPYCEVRCRHIVMPSLFYTGETKWRTPFVSIYIDCDNQHVMEEIGVRRMKYNVPRWQRIRGTQYAVSPAVIAALPEARLLQAMTLTLLTAGEKMVDPPLIATQGMVRDDINVHAGGITWVAADYDERQGSVLRPLLQDKSGMPLGLELQQRSEVLLKKAFFADKLQMPHLAPGGPEKTAYEVGQQVQQFLQYALPLVEPLEIEVNGGDWEGAFNVLLDEGYFGLPDDIPESLRGEEVEFKFTSPLREQTNRQKARIFLDGVELINAGAALDPAVASIPNAVEAMREALGGIGWETKWMRSKEDVQAAADAEAEQAQAQAMLNAVGQAASAAKDLSAAKVVPA